MSSTRRTSAPFSRLADVYEATGRLNEALTMAEQGLRIRGADLVKADNAGRIYAELGRRSEALRVLGNVLKSPHPNGMQLGRLYFALGDKDRGFEWMKRAFDDRLLVVFVKFDPAFDKVRSDPRFDSMVSRLQMPLAR